MNKKVTKVAALKKKLKEIDEQFFKDLNLEEMEAFRRKYGTLTEDDLRKTFTI